MRVVVFAESDAATDLLETLSGCKVLGVRAGDVALPLFSKRCAELNFDCLSTDDAKLIEVVVVHFRPEIALFVGGRFCAGAGKTLFCSEFMPPTTAKYTFQMGCHSEEARWPEFAPIWEQWRTSRVSLIGKDNEEIGAVEVPLTECETGLSLRTKHMQAATRLIASLAREEQLPKLAKCFTPPSSSVVPDIIASDWDIDMVERFIRASTMPPHKPAEVVDPNTGDKYLIENLMQYDAFQQKVVTDAAAGKDIMMKQYVADTHWYSNAGGTVIKINDQSQHMPCRSQDIAIKSVIPGATLGAVREKLRMNEPLIGPNAEQYCCSALKSGWIGVEGPFVKKFEAQLANVCGCASACAVQSGTAALYGAMKGLGVSEPSQHVLVPSFTCAAAADAVVHAGGTPIAIDCEFETYGISVDAVRAALTTTPNVVGVIAAHCYGVPIRDLHDIHKLCVERGLWLCEDACETFGAAARAPGNVSGFGRSTIPIGSLGTLSVISVRSEKMIGVGEGGAIVGNDTTLVARAKWWCSRAPCRGAGLWRVYEHEGVGQNFRLPELLACVGCAAAEMLPTVIDRKRQIHAWYEKYINRPGLDGVKLQSTGEGDRPVWWVNSALMPDGISGEEVGMQLMKDFPDIEIRPGFFPLDQQKIFKYPSVKHCPNSDALFRRLVCMPSSVKLQEEQIERVCGALAASLKIVSERSSSS